MNKNALYRLFVLVTLFGLLLSACTVAPTEEPTLTPAPTEPGAQPTSSGAHRQHGTPPRAGDVCLLRAAV